MAYKITPLPHKKEGSIRYFSFEAASKKTFATWAS